MATATYHQFCPVSMAAEILGSRWTIVLLREFCAGSTRFNELRRGVPRMSPALLSKRLKELEEHGVIERRMLRRRPDVFDYVLTEAGEDLKPLVMAIGVWGQRWVETESSLERVDSNLLMWDMRRNLNVKSLPQRRLSIQFTFPEQAKGLRNYWILLDPETEPDLCKFDPGFDVDLYVTTDLRTLTAIWMGQERVASAVADERMFLVGDDEVSLPMQTWLGLSPFATTQKQVS